MLPECHSLMLGVLVFAIRRIPLFISLNRAMIRKCCEGTTTRCGHFA